MTRFLRIFVWGALVVGPTFFGYERVSKGGGLVTLYVALDDAEMEQLSFLRPSDVEVWHNGQQVAVRDIARAQPLSVVVLLDATSTMSSVMVPFVWDGTYEGGGIKVSGSRGSDSPVDLFLNPIRDGFLRTRSSDDRVRFGTIAAQPRLSREFRTSDSALTEDLLDLLRMAEKERYGPSPIWDAVGEAIRALASEPGQKAIVLVTDGFSTGNRLGSSQVASYAVGAGVSVSVIHEWPRYAGRGLRIADSTRNPWMIIHNPLGDSPQLALRRLAELSGGLYFLDDSSSQRGLTDLLRRALDRLHRSYSMTLELTPKALLTRRPDIRLSTQRERRGDDLGQTAKARSPA